MTTPSYDVPPVWLPNEATHRRLLGQGVQNLFQGKMNATTKVTLTVSSTTTTVIDSRIGASTSIHFSATTADAAAALPGLYVSAQQKGQATLTHASSSSTDRTFNVLLIG